MGLGVHVRAEIPKTSRPRGEKNLKAFWQNLVNQIGRVISDPLERRLIDLSGSSDGFEAVLDPLAEPIMFTIEDNRDLVASAKTSTLGPGYHAMVVALLDTIAESLGTKFQWSADEEGDETGYAVDRDFAALQQSFARFTSELARLALGTDDAEDGCMWLNWPIGSAQPATLPEWAAASPSGPLTRAWLTRAVEGPDEGMCRAFYPWWNRERDAHYWAASCRAMIWSSIRWHPPTSEHESELMDLCLACADRALELNPEIELPNAELAEIRALKTMDPDAFDTPPASEGLGYFRGMVRHQLPGDWTVELPGYYFTAWEDDGGSAVFAFADRSLHIATMSFDVSERATDADRQRFLHDATTMDLSKYPAGARLVQFHEGDHRGVAAIFTDSGPDGSFTIVQGQMAVFGEMAVATITLGDPNDVPWAESVIKGLRHSDFQISTDQ